jgi:hypothetical protein
VGAETTIVPSETLVLKLNELVAVIVLDAPTIDLKIHHEQVEAAPTVIVDVLFPLVFDIKNMGLVLVPDIVNPLVNVKLAPSPI